MVHTYDGGGVFIIYCVWGVKYCVWRVIVCCAVLCSLYVKVAARVVIIYVCTVARVSPLIYDYYNVLYGAILETPLRGVCRKPAADTSTWSCGVRYELFLGT